MGQKPITVNQLIARLQKLKLAGAGDAPVWYATDEEGNGFEPIYNEAGCANMDDSGFPLEDFDPKKPYVCIVN